MRRLIFLVTLVVLVVILAGPSASAVSDSDGSATHTDIYNNEIITNQTEGRHSSASDRDNYDVYWR